MRNLAIAFAIIGITASRAGAQTLFVPQTLQPFTAATKYMSVAGYLRWRNYVQSGNWSCQGLVKFREEILDSQEGAPDGVSGMDIKSVTPQLVTYTLRINQGAPRNLPYHATAVRLDGIFGDAIRIDLDDEFCIGPDHHYELTKFVALDGLLDRVRNRFEFENKQRTQRTRFHLEYGRNGDLLAIDEANGKSAEIHYEDGFFRLPSLTPVAPLALSP